ncbi:MAG: hypothetical protein NT163_00880 [Chlorobiales bacterium]|nr:hypothetical protein [Chlorobiales bacterium]
MYIQGEEIIQKSVSLRDQREFDDAVKLIEENIDLIDPSIRMNAWLEAFRAAEEKGDFHLAKKIALIVAQENPNEPEIENYL